VANARIVRQSLRLYPVAQTYGPTKWGPAFSFDLRGPVPSGSQVIVAFQKPDGSDWLTSTVDVNEQGDDAAVTCTGAIHEEELQTDETGAFGFSLKLVSELEGVDKLLGKGTLRIEKAARQGDRKAWRVRADARLASGTVQVDGLESDPDAPVLTASVWLGDTEEHQLAAYLFFNGKKLRSSEKDEAEVSSALQLSDSDGNGGAREFTVKFDTVRGFINGGWGDADSWHDLSKNPGKYEVKVAREKKLERVLAFEVGKDGKLVATGPVEPLGTGALRMHAKVATPGKHDVIDAALAAEPWYGLGPPAVDLGCDALYAGYQGNEAPAAPSADEEALKEEAETVGGKADNIVSWHEGDVEAGGDAYDFLLQCEMAVSRVDELLPRLEALAAKSGAGTVPFLVPFDGGDAPCAEVKARLEAIRTKAQGWIAKKAAAESDSVAPFLALLRDEKARQFSERPRPGYRYYTSGKREIETPEELAAAAVWYFEGSEDQGLITEKWTVLGLHFDEDHGLRETTETSGFGTRAPSSAFP
jgi:hypothetical protein